MITDPPPSNPEGQRKKKKKRSKEAPSPKDDVDTRSEKPLHREKQRSKEAPSPPNVVTIPKEQRKKKKKRNRDSEAQAEKPAKRKKIKRPHPEPGEGRTAAEPSTSAAAAPAPPAAPPPAWPFQPHPADHCETPRIAYAELAPVLHRLAGALHGGDGGDGGGSSPAVAAAAAAKRLRIYDPYFCTGRVKEHLAALGFTQVHNECEDFYRAVDNNEVPDFDVLVTNPPYTACAAARPRPSLFHGTTDHVERLLRFCRAHGKPAALLLPSYVYMKSYFGGATAGMGVAAVEPSGRYAYDAPRAGPGDEAFKDASGQTRNKKTKKTAPFMSFWYLLAPPPQDSGERRWWAAQAKARPGAGAGAGAGGAAAPAPRIHALSALPMQLRDSSDPSRVKPRSSGGLRTSRDGRPLCRQCGQIVGCCKHTKK